MQDNAILQRTIYKYETTLSELDAVMRGISFWLIECRNPQRRCHFRLEEDCWEAVEGDHYALKRKSIALQSSRRRTPPRKEISNPAVWRSGEASQGCPQITWGSSWKDNFFGERTGLQDQWDWGHPSENHFSGWAIREKGDQAEVFLWSALWLYLWQSKETFLEVRWSSQRPEGPSRCWCWSIEEVPTFWKWNNFS